ncbi:MAG: class I SAM-dependent methyltransferase [Candidatus Kapabacteria bacterium]|nr:class I SAM-dependent methyltransferase [Candidatus Kapabacteria bacterium]
METTDRNKHWENIYRTKEVHECSWYQPTPTTSLYFFKHLNIPVTASVIDVGGGDGFLVDHLLDVGYRDITVLDISASAIERAKTRLAERAALVKWIVADAALFIPDTTYDVWHDRAAFHFLTSGIDISHYVETVGRHINPAGVLILGTFSEQGPKKCSGIDIKQYSESTMTNLLNDSFEKIECMTIDHATPFGTTQNFLFCSFRKRDVVT